MADISTLDKLTSVMKYAYDYITNKGPYKKVIFNDKFDEYKKHTDMMNKIEYNNKTPDSIFSSKQRVLISYLGEKNFNTVIVANSYFEIHNTINYIINNAYTKKRFGDFTKFIDKIYLVTYNDGEIDVTNDMNIIVQYKEEIKISDLPLLHKTQSKDIKSIKILHYNDFALKEIILDFDKNMDRSVDALNEWIE